MATFTITTPVNIDSLAGKTGNDTYTINGGVVTIDQHSRYGVEASTSATIGTVSLSSSLAGDFRVTTEFVRLIYFNSGSGNVPAYNTTISQGSASGLLIGVYDTDYNVAPTTPGSAMPSSGYILIKQWNEVAFTSGALTGIGASCTTDPVTGVAGDRQGWIEVVGEEGRGITLNRLNNPTEELFKGDYIEIGTTTGTNSDTYQIPSNGVNQYHAGVWVETATPGEYEFYPTTVDTATPDLVSTTERKGKFCWISTAGLLRFGHDGTNSTGGYTPPAGRKIKMGSIFLANALPASRTQNNLNATQSTRYSLITSNAGVIRIKGISASWNFLNLVNCAVLDIQDSSFIGRVGVTNAGTPFNIERIGIGQPILQDNSVLFFSGCLEGGTITDAWLCKGKWHGSNNYILYSLNSLNIECSNVNLWATGLTFTSHFATYFLTSSNITIDGGSVCGRMWGSTSNNIQIRNIQWWANSPQSNFAAGDHLFSGTTVTNSIIEDIDIADGDAPSNYVILLNSSCDNVKIRNIGTYSNPVEVGRPSYDNAAATRSGTVATVTAVGHGMKTNDNIYVYRQSSNITGLTVGAKLVTVIDPDTFTCAASNSGGTSGNIGFVPAQSVGMLSATNSSNIKVQNVHLHGYRTSVYIAANTNKNIYLENVTALDNPYIPVGSAGAANLRLDSVQSSSWQAGVIAAVYGSHFLTGFDRNLSLPMSYTGVSFTRSSTTVIVVSPDHGLVPGTVLQIGDSTNPAGTLSGRTRPITILSKDQFQYTGVNTGATSGTLDYYPVDSKIQLQMNEPNADSASLFTVNSGNPLFTGAGTWSALAAGDAATWEFERYVLGFDSIPVMLPQWILGGGNELNYRLEYDINIGSGYTGSLKNWFYPCAGGSITSGSPTMTMTDTTGVAVGDYIFQAGVPYGTKVDTVVDSTTITMDTNATLTTSGQTPIFNNAPNEATFPSTGVKFKIKISLINASTQPVSFVNIPMTSTSVSRARLYPQDTPETQSVTVTNGVANTRIQVYDVTADEELANEIVTSFPYTWTDPVPYVADREIRVRASWVDGTDAKNFVDTIIGTATDTEPALSYRLNQTDDDVYTANAIDGSTITDIEFVDSTMHININTGSISAGQVYAYEVYWLYTEEGIRDLGQTIEAVDQANYRVTGVTIKNVTSPETPLSITGGWLVDSVTGLAVTLLDTTGGSIFNAPDHIVPFATGSGVTPGDVIDIANAVQTELNDDFAAIPTATDTATATVSAITPQLEEILSDTDATQAKVNQL